MFRRQSLRLLNCFMTSLQMNSSKNDKSYMAGESRKVTDDRLVWIDLEMTGLDAQTCHIVEIAVIITEGDDSLKIVAEGPNIIIHQPASVVKNMSEWCKNTFEKSGLTKAVMESKISVEQAEESVLDFVRKYTKHGACPLAGNSVYVDRSFLKKYMPKFDAHLHYRIVDVSTVKELCRRWFPQEYSKAPTKNATHRALDDIKESIAELKYYKRVIFK